MHPYYKAFLVRYLEKIGNGPKREGGKTSSVTKFALRSEDQNTGHFVSSVDRDGSFARNGVTVNHAVLFDTADEAAQAIERRNAAYGGWASRYSIVPVTVTTTEAVYEVTTTPATAPKTVYRVRHMPSGNDVKQVETNPGIGFRWIKPIGGAPTDYATRDDALDAIEERNDQWPTNHDEFGIIPVHIPGSPVKIERKLITPASTTRSL